MLVFRVLAVIIANIQVVDIKQPGQTMSQSGHDQDNGNTYFSSLINIHDNSFNENTLVKTFNYEILSGKKIAVAQLSKALYLLSNALVGSKESITLKFVKSNN